MKYFITNKFKLTDNLNLSNLDLNTYLLRDGESVGNNQLSEGTRFHVDNNDYLGTIATVIDLHLQAGNERKMRESLEKIRDDLVYLQKNYTLVKK